MIRFAIYTKAERGLASLSALLERRLKPALCVSEDSDKETVALCEQQGVSVLVERKPKDPAHIRSVHDAGIELLVCAGYSKILPGGVVRAAETGRHQLSWWPFASIPGRLADSLADYPRRNSRRCLRAQADGRHRRWSNTGERAIWDRGASDTARSITHKVTAIFGRIVPDVVQKFVGWPVLRAARAANRQGARHWTRRVPADGEVDWPH